MPSPRERLSVYPLSARFLVFANEVVLHLLRRRSHLAGPLTRASISLVRNIGKGAKTLSRPDKRRYYLAALGSVTRCTAILDDCLRLTRIPKTRREQGKKMLADVGKMLTALAKSMEGNGVEQEIGDGVDPASIPAILPRMDSAAASASRLPSVPLVPEPKVEDTWVLTEETLPESNPHRDIVDLLRLLLSAFIARTSRDALAAANLACRWNTAKRNLGVDPDIALIEPAPPEGAKVESLRTWVPGHVPPRFAVEVVSPGNATKDYDVAPAKYARLGTRELVIFDPTLVGPSVRGGPYVLQVWRRDARRRRLVRVVAGSGPAFSEELAAWLVPTPGPRLRIADDAEGRSLWLTEAEEHGAASQQAVRGLRTAIEDMCEICGIPLDGPRRARIESLDVAALGELRGHIKRERAWPWPDP